MAEGWTYYVRGVNPMEWLRRYNFKPGPVGQGISFTENSITLEQVDVSYTATLEGDIVTIRRNGVLITNPDQRYELLSLIEGTVEKILYEIDERNNQETESEEGVGDEEEEQGPYYEEPGGPELY